MNLQPGIMYRDGNLIVSIYAMYHLASASGAISL